MPIYFEPNQGQTDPRVRFLSRGSGYRLFLTDHEAVLVVPTTNPEQMAGLDKDGFALSTHRAGQNVESAEPSSRQAVVRLKMLGARSQPRIRPLEVQPGKVNYFIGSDPSAWRTGLPTYGRLLYEGVYPGIDLVYYGKGGVLEYDWVLAPGADPDLIRIGVEGIEDMSVSPEGDLILRTASEELRQSKPLIYQEDGTGRQQLIGGGFRLLGPGEFGFEVGEYDRSRTLIIDPLIYSTYLGGGGQDFGNSIAVDSLGQAYITGDTLSSGAAPFPTQNAFQPANAGLSDAFVTKLAADGSLSYSTYLGGGGNEFGFGIAVDSLGQAYITGETGSSGGTPFPTQNALQPALAGSSDAFVTKLAANGSLVYSTYLGGGAGDLGSSIAVDALGQAYITGATISSGGTPFPIKNAFQPALAGGTDAFVTKLAADGSALLYSTYLGGGGDDFGRGIAVDSFGQAYITGNTSSGATPFPTQNAFQPALAGSTDAFVTKLAADGSTLLYSTYLGGGDSERGSGIAADSLGQAYITGRTNSSGGTPFPTLNAFQPALAGLDDAFVTKLAADGSLSYSTYLGGGGNDRGFGVGVNFLGQASVTGSTSSSGATPFPTKNAFQSALAGSSDAFVTKLAASGSLVYSTYLGGGGVDRSFGIAVDSLGQAYITGDTNSSGGTPFPTLNAFQPNFGGGVNDAFVAKLDTTVPRPLLQCVYECRADQTGRLWRELTALVVSNPFSSRSSARADLFFYDGANTALGCATTSLGIGDMDVIQVCETLDRAIPAGAPQSGLVQALVELPEDADPADFVDWNQQSGVWMKNFSGEFRRSRFFSGLDADFLAEPANGILQSLSKAACQLVWRTAPIEKCDPQSALPLIFIEQ